MRILNWNTQADRRSPKNKHFPAIRNIVAKREPDIVCLTEAYPEAMPNGGQVVSSGLSGWYKHERLGARKVLIWSKTGWHKIDAFGSKRLPEGRFIGANTLVYDIDMSVVGMCIPYFAYRTGKKLPTEERKRQWQGACEYLDALREDILPQPKYRERTILLGDFNLQIPAKNHPYPSSPVNKKREATFREWTIPTSGELDCAALDRRFIDHVAMSDDLEVTSMQFIRRFGKDGSELSDHNGVCIDIRVIPELSPRR